MWGASGDREEKGLITRSPVENPRPMTSTRTTVRLFPSQFLALLVALLWLLNSSGAVFGAGARITGQVLDGTTGRPISGQTLQLLMPRGGMQEVGTATTNSSGRFEIAASDLTPDSFYLLQATYQDVNYHAPVRFDDRGQAQVDITVYDTARAVPSLRIQSARIIVRAEGGKAHVQEMFAVSNPANPPRTYANSDGTFRFHLGKTITEPTAAVAGLMNMPLPQPVSPGKADGDYSIQYPLKPGLTVVMVTYDSDYISNRLALRDSVAYPIDRAELLVVPSTLSVDSAIFKAAGTDAESGGQKYAADHIAADTEIKASISGEAAGGEMPAATQAASPSPSEVKPLPNSMTRMGGLLLACFLMILLWGLGLRAAKEWPKWKAQQSAGRIQKALEVEVEKLFCSIADLDELFASGKIAEKPYWKERLELKARLAAKLKKAPVALLESYAIRNTARQGRTGTA